MAAETITIYIDPGQLKAQKANNYSLFVAKKVNGVFTVIWQSKGPFPTVTNPADYEYKNTFEIAVPSYQVNYGTVTTQSGSVTFQAGGQAVGIDLGQSVVLDASGIFDGPTNNGTAGEITIANALQGNPVAQLLDDAGNPIFVNTTSGMDVGPVTLTPIDTYQIWFDNYQDTGTVIAENQSNPATVTFAGGSTDQTISYTAAGTWEQGKPADDALDLHAPSLSSPIVLAVLATFKYALTAAAVTYLAHDLIGKFAGGLKPKTITVDGRKKLLEVVFAQPKNADVLARFGMTAFEAAVNSALVAAKAVPASGLSGEAWTISTPSVSVSY